jgi:hypothetical protein
LFFRFIFLQVRHSNQNINSHQNILVYKEQEHKG